MNQTFIGRASKFVTVGVISTTFNYMIFYTLYKFFQANYLLASACGYISGTGLGFVLNNFWTFGFYESAMKKIVGYLVVYLFSLGLSSLFLWVVVDLLHFNPAYMNVLAIGISTVSNFTGLNFIIYRK